MKSNTNMVRKIKLLYFCSLHTAKRYPNEPKNHERITNKANHKWSPIESYYETEKDIAKIRQNILTLCNLLFTAHNFVAINLIISQW